MLSSELSQPLGIAQGSRIGECPLDLVGAREHFGESIAKRQRTASAPLPAKLLPEAFDTTCRVH